MKHSKIVRILSLLLLVCMVASIVSCSPPTMEDIDFSEVNITNCQFTDKKTEYVFMNVSYTDKNNLKQTGDIIVRLFPDVAPKTVKNFQDLVADQFYDGLTFHRVYDGFMIQGGDPEGNGTGDSGTKIKGEFSKNGIENNLSHTRGVVSMARGAYSYDSASCQFFIVHEDSEFLDGEYASFGYVVYGMDTVDGIAKTHVTYGESGEKTTPVNTVTINFMKFVTVSDEAVNEITPSSSNTESPDVNIPGFNAEISSEPTNYVMMDITYTNAGGKETTGQLVMELYPDVAPITVENFKSLVADEFYDGLTFHRVYDGFMIQGGDPKGNGSGDSGTRIKGEFTANGVENNLSHTRGVVSMARGSYSYDSASCQFFIVHADSTFLDGQYASFGRVIYGMDTVDGIAKTAVKFNSGGKKTSPIKPVTINYAKFVTVTDSAAE